ncbi:MAG: YbbR-like domain-containing protein, partial [Polyangiaceae bacterium]|nr:YbbR-like domain-containing protein [Polyangiaceae bacterium]
ISLARGGRLFRVDSTALSDALVAQLRQKPKRSKPNVKRMLIRSAEPIVALGFAFATWLVMVPGAATTSRTLSVPVTVESLPEGYELTRVDPSHVKITVSGPRRAMYLLEADDVRAVIDAWSVELGRRAFVLGPDEVRHPSELSIERVEPRRVYVAVRRARP